MSINFYECWLGYGLKTGGTLFLAGVEGVSGQVFNLGDGTATRFNMLSARIGLGLGAGTGLCAVAVFNALSLWPLNNKTNTDWGVNFSFGGKWLESLKLLKQGVYAEMLIDATKQLSKTKKLDFEKIEKYRTVSSALWTVGKDGILGKGPRMMMIDIPLAGIGLELSAHYLEGKMKIGG